MSYGAAIRVGELASGLKISLWGLWPCSVIRCKQLKRPSPALSTCPSAFALRAADSMRFCNVNFAESHSDAFIRNKTPLDKATGFALMPLIYWMTTRHLQWLCPDLLCWPFRPCPASVGHHCQVPSPALPQPKSHRVQPCSPSAQASWHRTRFGQ
jgi:hypothetical protein